MNCAERLRSVHYTLPSIVSKLPSALCDSLKLEFAAMYSRYRLGTRNSGSSSVDHGNPLSTMLRSSWKTMHMTPIGQPNPFLKVNIWLICKLPTRKPCSRGTTTCRQGIFANTAG